MRLQCVYTLSVSCASALRIHSTSTHVVSLLDLAQAGIREHLRYGDNDLLAFDGACAKLTGAGFALWDVIGSTAAERPDSMDSTIVDARLNPIREVLLRAFQLR